MIPVISESDLPQFQGKKLEPVGQLPGQKGMRVLTKKESGPMWKALKAMQKTVSKSPKGPKKISRRGRVRRVESDSKVHLQHGKYY